MMAESLFQQNPDLLPFLQHSVQPTGKTLGTGSYGSVEEVVIPGAICAAKTIHDFFQDPRQVPRHAIEKSSEEFVKECRLMSSLRHPHIVQFLGLCFLPGSRMPALVMEKLVISLHEVLDPDPPLASKPFIPVSLKCSIIHNVASGLSFLHNQEPWPIIHRDLSARNVLLNEGMVAKIADLGMARIIPGTVRPAALTKAPGASIYMPPEALEDKSRYDVTIDIFSLGIIAVFTLSQMFPDPLPATYIDNNGKMASRTELERRANYMAEILRQFRDDHPLVRMIGRCLKNRADLRPSIQHIQVLLEEAIAGVRDAELNVDKLTLTQLLQCQKQKTDTLREEFTTQLEINQRLRTLSEELQDQVDDLREGAAKDASGSPVKFQPSLNWKLGSELPTRWLRFASSVVIDGKVYCGGPDPISNIILQLNPRSGLWTCLSRPPNMTCFTIASLNSRLVIVSAHPRIMQWNSVSRKWSESFPSIPYPRGASATLQYQNYFIMACGYPGRKDVEILDILNNRWLHAQSLPIGGHIMSSAMVGDCWYLASLGGWEDSKEHVFCANLNTLVSSAMSGNTNRVPVWQELPTPPTEKSPLLALQGHLLLVGGRKYIQDIYCYDKNTKEWKVCGQLPIGMIDHCCVALPSGHLMVTGGRTGDTKTFSKRTWIA